MCILNLFAIKSHNNKYYVDNLFQYCYFNMELIIRIDMFGFVFLSLDLVLVYNWNSYLM